MLILHVRQAPHGAYGIRLPSACSGHGSPYLDVEGMKNGPDLADLAGVAARGRRPHLALQPPLGIRAERTGGRPAARLDTAVDFPGRAVRLLWTWSCAGSLVTSNRQKP